MDGQTSQVPKSNGDSETTIEEPQKVKLPAPHVLKLYPGQSVQQIQSPTQAQSVPTQPGQSQNEMGSLTRTEVQPSTSDQGLHHHHHHHHGSSKHKHHHHHHHHHHHKAPPNSNNQSDTTHEGEGAVVQPETRIEGPAKKQKTAAIDTKEALKALVGSLTNKRAHLGTVIYNPTTTWESLQIEQLHGLDAHDRQRLLDIREGFVTRVKEAFSAESVAYIPVLPPLTDLYTNNFVDVKIPYRFVKSFILQFTAGRIQKKRELWGGLGGIYTDDSDILSVLCHLGLFDDKLDLTDTNSSWTKADLVRPMSVQQDEDNVDLLDLSVTLLLLPTLKKYQGFFKNGINSRTWDNVSPHDGLSFAVYNVKWETYENSTGDRNLHKIAQRENLSDLLEEQKFIETDHGWQFDYKYFKQLQEKYKAEANGENLAQVQNGV